MKKCYLLLFFLAAFFPRVWAQPPGWSYSQPYTITNNSSTLGVGVQIKLTINTQTLISANQMQVNGNDIRFGKNCAGNPLYDYWIESGVNTPNTIVWVKVDTLFPNASRVIYLFYGNPTAVAASTLSIFGGPFSSTNQITGGTVNLAPGACQRGFRFSPNTDILVTQFGKIEPNGTTRYVTLFDNTTQAIVYQTQVSGPAAVYSYATLPNPFWLAGGFQYIHTLNQIATDGYYYQVTSQINSNLTYYDMRYCNACNQNVFPTTVLANYHYGYPDFTFYTRNILSPAPTYVSGGSGGGGGSLTSQPTSITACPGSIGTFTVGISGTATVQWQVNTGSGWTNILNNPPYSGATSSSLNINPVTAAMNGYQYQAVVNGSCGQVISNVVTLTVPSNAPATINITANPGSPICAGTSVTFSSTITNGGATPTYQWKINGVNVSGATNSTFTTSTLTNGNVITCSFTSSNNCAVPSSNTSNSITMTVNPIPIANPNNNGPLCAGQTLNLTVNTFPNATYTWSGPGFASTQQNPSITNVQTAAAGVYTVTAVALNCTSGPHTTTVVVHALPAANITANGSVNICIGDTVTLSANTGSGLTYQWQKNSVNIPGATSSTYKATTPGIYLVIVRNGFNCTNASNTIVVQAKPMPVPAISHTTPLTFCEGLSVVLRANTAPNLTYQWYKNGNVIVGATDSSYTAYQSGTYTLRETNDFGCTDLSSGTTVTVWPVLNPVITKDGNILNTSGFVYYQWFMNNVIIPGATSSSYTVSQPAYYQVEGTDANGCVSKSAIAWVQSLGVKGFITAADINIYPNPTKDRIFIKSPIKVDATIRNMQGQVIMQASEVTEIDLGRFADGVYSITLYSQEGMPLKTERLIKMQ